MGPTVVHIGTPLDPHRDWFFENAQFVDPTEAVETVRNRENDTRCVVCPDVLDGTDTVDLVRSIREVDGSIPVLLYSDATDGDLAIDAIRAGVTEYVSRERLEQDGERLSDRIDAILHRSGSSRTDDAAVELHKQTAALESLYQITSDRSRSFEEKVGDLLELGCERLDLDIGYLSEIEDDRFRLVDSRGAEALLESLGKDEVIDPDGTLPLAQTYCRRTVDRGELSGFARGAEGTEWEDDLAYELFGLESYLGGPVIVDGELYGTLCFADASPRTTEFTQAERTFVELTVEWLSHEFERQTYYSELQETANRLQQTFERVSDAVFSLDEEWNFTYLNSRAETMLDRSGEELVGKNVWEEFSEALGQRYEREYRRAMETQEQVAFEEYYEPLDLWTEVNAYPSEDGLSVFFRDITDQKRREQTLRGLLETTRRLFAMDTRVDIAETMVEASESILGFEINGVHLYDPETDRLESVAASESVYDLVGQPPSYATGEGLIGTVFELNAPEVYDDISNVDAYDYGPVRSAIAVPIGEHGVLSVGSMTAGRFDDSDESVVQLLATSAAAALDRTERKSRLETYETVLETVEDMIFVLDADDRITYVTPTLAEWLEYDRERLLGESIAELLTEVFPDGTGSEPSDRSTDTTWETTAITAGDGTLPVEVRTTPLPTDDGNARVVGSVTDIHELTAAREELSIERYRFRQLFERIPDPVVEVERLEDRIEIAGVNTAFESVFGYEEESIVGRSINDLIVPDGKKADADALDMAIDSEGSATGEVTRRTANGLREFIFRGFVYQSDRTERAFGIYTDITEQKERERYLQVTNRIIRHNLRNDLNVIAGFAEVLCSELEESLHADYARRILDNATELIELAEDANTLQRIVGQNVRSTLDRTSLSPIVERACKTVEETHPQVTIDRSIPDSVEAYVDHRLELAVEHLLENAIEHTDRPDPVVRIYAQRRLDDETIELVIEDDGPGIDRSIRELITGQQEITQLDHNSGIGLWVVKWVVESYGGQISFDTGYDAGTRVILSIPV